MSETREGCIPIEFIGGPWDGLTGETLAENVVIPALGDRIPGTDLPRCLGWYERDGTAHDRRLGIVALFRWEKPDPAAPSPPTDQEAHG